MERLRRTMDPRHIFMGLHFLLPFIPETKIRKTLVDTQSLSRLSIPLLQIPALSWEEVRMQHRSPRAGVLITVAWLIAAL